MSERRAGGFVSVEMLAALALASLVLLTLSTALGLVVRAWERATERGAQLEALERGLTALGTDFATVRRVRWAGEFVERGAQAEGRTEPAFIFFGTPSAVGFVGRRLSPSPRPGDRLVLIEAHQEGETATLVRRDARLSAALGSFDAAEFVDPVALLAGPWRFRFAYRDGTGSGQRWLAQWTMPDRLPAAIRLEVGAGEGNLIDLPPLIVELHIAVSKCAAPGETPSCPQENRDGAGATDAPSGGAARGEDDILIGAPSPAPRRGQQ